MSNSESDFAYHLHRLYSADEEGQIIAADVLSTASIANPNLELSTTELNKLIELHRSGRGEVIENPVAKILSNLGRRDARLHAYVQELITDATVPVETIHTFVKCIAMRMQEEAILTQEAGIKDIVSDSRCMLQRSIENTELALMLLSNWSKAAVSYNNGIAAVPPKLHGITNCGLLDRYPTIKSAMEQSMYEITNGESAWLEATEELCSLKIKAKRRTFAIQMASLLRSQSFQDVIGAMDILDPRMEFHDLHSIIGSQQSTPTLDADEEELLARHMQNPLRTPTSYITELFESKSFIFLSGFHKDFIAKLPEMIEQLERETMLSHVAVNIREESRVHFQEFLQTGYSPELQTEFFGDDSDDAWISFSDEFLEVLRSIDTIEGVEWAFIGQDRNLYQRGENALDGYINRLMTILRSQQDAKMIVLDIPPIDFHMHTTLCKVTGVNGDQYVSIPHALAREIGRESIASLQAIGSGHDWRIGQNTDNEIDRFCTRYNLTRSFAFPIEGSVLEEKEIDADESTTCFKDAHTGLLVYVRGDDNDESDHSEGGNDPTSGLQIEEEELAHN